MKYAGITLLCFPADSICKTTRRKRLLQSAALFLQAVLLVLVVLLNVQQYVKNPDLKAGSPLSSRIIIALTQLSTVLSFAIIITSSFIFKREIQVLHDNLGVLKARERSCKGKFLSAFSTALSSVWFVVHSSGVCYFELKVMSNAAERFAIFPNNGLIFAAIIIFCVIWPNLILLYAWNWVMHYGAKLVDQLETLVDRLEGLLLQKNGMVLVQPSGHVENELMTLVGHFQRAQNGFEMYADTGGVYALALLIRFMFQCISLVSAIVDGNGSLGEMFAFIYVSISFSALAVIAYVGSHVTQSVS